MLGKTTLFVPGFDHGGISTEAVVEKRLYTKTGQTRRTLGRDALLSALQDWTNESVSPTSCPETLLERFCSGTSHGSLISCGAWAAAMIGAGPLLHWAKYIFI
jgi:hypothetical protein